MPTLEVTRNRTDMGLVQGSMLIELLTDDSTHMIAVHDGFLVQVPSADDCPASIVSRALHVASGCCSISCAVN